MICAGLFFSLTFASPALALTVTESDIDTTHSVDDVIVDSSGNIHAVVIEMISESQSNLIYKKYNGSSWSTTSIDTGVSGVNYDASINVDSTGKPAIAWVEWNDAANTQSLYYRKYTGSTWGNDTNTVTVESGMDDSSGRPALEFYKEGADLNYPTIFTCHGSTYVVEEHKAQANTDEPTFAAPTSVTNDGAYTCSSVDAHISSTDTQLVITSPEGGNSSAFEHYNSGGGWGGVTTIFTGIDSVNGSEIFLDTDGNNYYATIVDNLAGSGVDKIMYSKMSGGSWSAQETVASGIKIGQSQIDIIVDADNGIPYIVYFENSSTTAPFKYAYKQNGSWTSGNLDSSGFTLGTNGENLDYMNLAAGDYYATGTKIFVLGSFYLSGGGFDLNMYELTNLPDGGQGEGGGEGVPEFSTYVYAILLMTVFGFMYKRSRSPSSF